MTRLKRQSEGEPTALLEIGEAAALLGVDQRTVQRYCNAGRLLSVVVGKQRLIERAALDAFMEHGANPGASGMGSVAASAKG